MSATDGMPAYPCFPLHDFPRQDFKFNDRLRTTHNHVRSYLHNSRDLSLQGRPSSHPWYDSWYDAAMTETWRLRLVDAERFAAELGAIIDTTLQAYTVCKPESVPAQALEQLRSELAASKALNDDRFYAVLWTGVKVTPFTCRDAQGMYQDLLDAYNAHKAAATALGVHV